MESSERLIVHQDQDGSLETKESCHLRGRQRHQQKQPKEEVRFVPRRHSTPVTSHWNHSSTFDGRLFLSRLIKNGSPADYGCIGILIVLLGLCLVALYFCYFHFQWFHFHVTHAYAHIGHIEAQHLLGDKYLHGQGIDKDEVIIQKVSPLLSPCVQKLKSYVNTKKINTKSSTTSTIVVDISSSSTHFRGERFAQKQMFLKQ